MKILFWLSLAGILYTYVGYPIVMWMLARVRPRVAVDLPAWSSEFASMGCRVVAHGLVSDPQLRVIAAVRRSGNLSGRER